MSDSFTTESARWRALTIRDATANGHFVYTVKSTRIYCRPTCPARLARRANIGFCKAPADAEKLGYRACKRCKPDLAVQDDPQGVVIAKACWLIEEEVGKGKVDGEGGKEGKGLRLQDLAKSVGLTPRYFHKIFKERMGVTPNEYAKAKMAEKRGISDTDTNSLEIGQGQDNSDSLNLDLDAFDYNDLLDFNLDPTLPVDGSFSWGDVQIPDQGIQRALPTFGQELDGNVQTLSWNNGFEPDAMSAGSNSSGVDIFSDRILCDQLVAQNTRGWEPCMPTITCFEADAAQVVDTHVTYADFILNFNVEALAGWV
ncbi:hypothetical protein K504DRAFT_460467 [Pleomassaria siparia CBS 279.74]|uniref:HTH araC/xylS-type domain-containing protein n=1 Tax=Pleomassaria siparia CBS 279.74 TaxID=1314801 RepID=A0A6G1JYA9_9PLEO|nr:hypothetical protein K504DRAFT_460467 [Pleomassaria siparia CBS 279.74]